MMPEILVEYATVLRSQDGRVFRVRAFGAKVPDTTRRWRGWLEFVPYAGGAAVATQSETTQPDRPSTIYWARGLRAAYLEGALGRALHGPAGRAVWVRQPARPSVAINRGSEKTATSKKKNKAAGKSRVIELGSVETLGKKLPAEKRFRAATSEDGEKTAVPADVVQPHGLNQKLNAWDRWLLKSLGIGLE
jgi:hypothetical protein